MAPGACRGQAFVIVVRRAGDGWHGQPSLPARAPTNAECLRLLVKDQKISELLRYSYRRSASGPPALYRRGAMDVFDFPASLAESQSSPAASASPAASSSSAESASFGYGGAGAATTGSVFPRTFSNQRKQRRASSHRAPELTKAPLQRGRAYCISVAAIDLLSEHARSLQGLICYEAVALALSAEVVVRVEAQIRSGLVLSVRLGPVPLVRHGGRHLPPDAPL